MAAIGGLNDPELMEELIASGQADVVEMARQLLADPDFPNKVRMGKEDTARRCMRCLSCFSSEVTNGEPYCAINPETGRELEMKYDIPTAIKKRVLVVGGGVGGMQAALTCSARGHEVILCEKGNRLGGVLRCEEDVAFKSALDYYLNQQARAVEDSDIDLRLKTEVTPDYARKLNVDVIIAALGAQPIKPNIPGINAANVMSAQEAYFAPDSIGRNVVILGAGLVGVELGLHLIDKGRKVKNIEMLDHISDGGNFIHIMGLKVEIEKQGLEIAFNTKAREIKADQVICDTPAGEKAIAADTVIYAVGQRPLREEAIAMNFCAPGFYLIGDCITPRNITSATTEAFMTARNIGRL